MNLVALPAFADNYIWMLHDGRRALVVDPGDAAPVLAALDAASLELSGILVTHHHDDHIGGLEALMPRLRGPVVAPPHPAIDVPIRPVGNGELIDLLDLTFEVMAVPGHTLGHVAYFAEPPGQAPVLFCGDTLFSAGCGRLFEGTPAQMHASLQRLAGLSPATRVCCAHEYTLSNLRFARAAEPSNHDLAVHELHCQALRQAGQPTLPATIDLERRINPFLRTAVPQVIDSARAHGAERDDPVSVFAALRQWKNNFR